MPRSAMFAAVAVAACVAVPTASAQSGPPSTDIFLAPISAREGIPVVGTPMPVATSPGYDNQPSFTLDGRSILYTSIRGDGQSDIYRYDADSKRTTRVTATPESEYSAAVTPGRDRFSVVRVEPDSTQRLWSFALDGTNPRLVIESLKPVGYYAWVDATHVAAFVLGRPNALALVDLSNGHADTLARNIGRSIARLPDGSGFSYVQMRDSTATLIVRRGSNVQTWAVLPRGAEDVVWLPSGVVLASSGSKIYVWRAGDHAWSLAADLARDGLTQITRMAISPDGSQLAIVAMRGQPKHNR